MKDKKELLNEWYETGSVEDGEEVVVSRMPDSFQQMRASHETPSDDSKDKDVEIEVEVQNKDSEPEEESIEQKNFREVTVKVSLLFDTLRSYDEAINRGDEPMQTEFIKEKLKNLSVEVMRLIDGIWW